MEIINKEKLLFGLPIELKEGLGTIYQPKLKEIFDRDFQIERIFRAFNINKVDFLDSDIEELTNFDMFSLLASKESLFIIFYDLLESISILYKTDKSNIRVTYDNEESNGLKLISEIVIDNKYILNRNNYDYLCSIVKIILDIKENKIKEKEISEIEDIFEKRKRQWEKEHGKNDDNKNGYDLMDYANYIIHCENSAFSYQDVLDLTVYQLKNTFELYRNKENYNTYLKYKTSGNFKMEEEQKHWFFNR